MMMLMYANELEHNHDYCSETLNRSFWLHLRSSKSSSLISGLVGAFATQDDRNDIDFRICFLSSCFPKRKKNYEMLLNV